MKERRGAGVRKRGENGVKRRGRKNTMKIEGLD